MTIPEIKRLSPYWAEAIKSPDRNAYIASANLVGAAHIWDVAHMSVKDMCDAANLRQIDLHRLLGIPRRTVQGWWYGERRPPDYDRFMMALLLGLLRPWAIEPMQTDFPADCAVYLYQACGRCHKLSDPEDISVRVVYDNCSGQDDDADEFGSTKALYPYSATESAVDNLAVGESVTFGEVTITRER